MAVITGHRYAGSTGTCDLSDNRRWTPVTGEAVAVLRHQLHLVDAAGVVPLVHEGGVKVTAVHKTVIRTSDGRSWAADTKVLRVRDADQERGTPYLHPMT